MAGRRLDHTELVRVLFEEPVAGGRMPTRPRQGQQIVESRERAREGGERPGDEIISVNPVVAPQLFGRQVQVALPVRLEPVRVEGGGERAARDQSRMKEAARLEAHLVKSLSSRDRINGSRTGEEITAVGVEREPVESRQGVRVGPGRLEGRWIQFSDLRSRHGEQSALVVVNNASVILAASE